MKQEDDDNGNDIHYNQYDAGGDDNPGAGDADDHSSGSGGSDGVGPTVEPSAPSAPSPPTSPWKPNPPPPPVKVKARLVPKHPAYPPPKHLTRMPVADDNMPPPPPAAVMIRHMGLPQVPTTPYQVHGGWHQFQQMPKVMQVMQPAAFPPMPPPHMCQPAFTAEAQLPPLPPPNTPPPGLPVGHVSQARPPPAPTVPWRVRARHG